MKSDPLDFEISFFERLVKDNPKYIDALIPLAEAYTKKGLHKKGLQIDKRLARLCKDNPVIFYNLGCSYALVGDVDKAFDALRESIKLGYADLEHLKNDSDLKMLRGDPRFKDLITAFKIR